MSKLPHLSYLVAHPTTCWRGNEVIYSPVPKDPLAWEELQGRVQSIRWPVRQEMFGVFILIRSPHSIFSSFYFFSFFAKCSKYAQHCCVCNCFCKLILVSKVQIFPTRLYCQMDVRHGWILGDLFLYFEYTTGYVYYAHIF